MANQLTVKQELTEFLLYTTPNGKVKVDGFVKSPNSLLRYILRFFMVR